MNLAQQIVLAIKSPFVICKAKTRTIIFLGFYLACNAAIFGAFSFFLLNHQDWIKQQLMDYLLPSSWQGISEWLISFFFESQTKIVLIGMITSGSLLLASMLLFPLKEYCSKKFEDNINPASSSQQDFPLWLQALEELKLLFLYVTAQSLIFAIGYYPYPWCDWLSSTLSILFLCFSFGLDFSAPPFQRRRIKYHSIVKFLVKKLPTIMVFGALFALPVMYVGDYLLSAEKANLAQTTVILFALNVIFLTLAIPAGTYCGINLLNSSSQPINNEQTYRIPAYAFLSITLLVSGTLHYLVAMSMHHKSQILKCHYAIDWSSLDYEAPNFSAFIKGESPVKLSFDLKINNPTPFDVEVENSIFIVKKNGQLLNESHLNEIYVGSKQTAIQPVNLQTKLDINAISNWFELDRGWSMELIIELLPGLPFTIQILDQKST